MDLQYPEQDEKPYALNSVGGAQAIITAIKEVKSACVKLYDSGATWHLSPYYKDFITYQFLKPPLYLNAAIKQQFPAVGIGSMVINVLLGPHS